MKEYILNGIPWCSVKDSTSLADWDTINSYYNIMQVIHINQIVSYAAIEVCQCVTVFFFVFFFFNFRHLLGPFLPLKEMDTHSGEAYMSI